MPPSETYDTFRTRGQEITVSKRRGSVRVSVTDARNTWHVDIGRLDAEWAFQSLHEARRRGYRRELQAATGGKVVIRHDEGDVTMATGNGTLRLLGEYVLRPAYALKEFVEDRGEMTTLGRR